MHVYKNDTQVYYFVTAKSCINTWKKKEKRYFDQHLECVVYGVESATLSPQVKKRHWALRIAFSIQTCSLLHACAVQTAHTNYPSKYYTFWNNQSLSLCKPSPIIYKYIQVLLKLNNMYHPNTSQNMWKAALNPWMTRTK